MTSTDGQIQKRGGGASRGRAETTDFLRAVIEQAPDVIAVTDDRGRVIYATPAAADLAGPEPSDPVGRSIFELVHPEDEPAQRELFELMLSEPGRLVECEFRLRHGDGGTRVLEARGRNLLDRPEVGGVVFYLRDVTVQREGERDWKQLEEQLFQAQKMEAVGRLAGGIAHGFNNLLTAIGGYAGMAAERSEDPQVSADIAEVVNATDRARSLVDKLLAFSRQSQGLPRAVDVNALIRRTAAVLRRTLGEGIRLELSLQDDLWPAHSEAEQLEQALVNLAVNARDAMPEGGVLALRTDRVSLDGERARRLGESLEPGEYVRITVADTGMGIDREIQDRIFDPFFTTKPVGKGSGLGLSMVFGAMTRLGGAITVDSTPGEGTAFMLYMPRAEPSSKAPAGESGAAPARDRPEETMILLVEDEDAVRALARRVLAREGYGVVEAETGVAAERVLGTLERPPDLLLTDVIMPEMGGPALADRIQARWPGLPVLYMSGYTADELASRGMDEREENFLPKPFTPDQLAAAVRAVLGH